MVYITVKQYLSGYTLLKPLIDTIYSLEHHVVISLHNTTLKGDEASAARIEWTTMTIKLNVLKWDKVTKSLGEYGILPEGYDPKDSEPSLAENGLTVGSMLGKTLNDWLAGLQQPPRQ